jgi:CP family cyanate transporter-like MFS transporter
MSTKEHERVEMQTAEQSGRGRGKTVLLVVGIVLLAANLRACITAVGPLTGAIRGTTGLSNILLGLLTALPLLAFGLVSSLAPRLGRRWGLETMLLISGVGLTVGILLRSLPTVSLLFAGTALLGASIAISNVLLPGLIKRDFPRQIGLMTALFSTLMSASGAIADGLSIPLAQGSALGWRGSLAFWALPAAVATITWLPLLRLRARTPAAAADSSVSGIWRSPLAWQVTCFMGLQSLTFYATIAWFPAIFQHAGLSASNAGWMLAFLQGAGIVGSFVAPQIAGRMRNQRAIVACVILMAIIAYIGILSNANGLIVLWCLLLGLASGAYLSLALLFFILRTPNARAAAELSGMAQSVGYLLASTGPLLFGALHDLTSAWTVPLLSLIAVSLILLVVGMGAARDRVITLENDSERPVHAS